MIGELLRGARYIPTGVGLLRRAGVRRFVIIPLIISAIVFSAGIWFAGRFIDGLIDTMIPPWLDWLRYLLWPVFALVALIIVYFAFTLIANLIGAPFNGLLAEAVETSLTGRNSALQLRWQQLPRELAGIMLSEVRKMAHFALWTIPFIAVLFIPVIGPPLWFLFGAWVFACNYADYPMGNHGMRFADQRRLLATRRAMSIGFGSAAVVLTLIPVVNFIAMPAAVAGVTAMYLAEFRKPGEPREP